MGGGGEGTALSLEHPSAAHRDNAVFMQTDQVSHMYILPFSPQKAAWMGVAGVGWGGPPSPHPPALIAPSSQIPRPFRLSCPPLWLNSAP